MPGVNYDYPFLNSAVAAVISMVFGCNAVTAHFALSLFSILASGFIGFMMVKDKSKTTIAPLLAVILFMFCHWRYGYISAAPDDLGLLLLLATIYSSTSAHVKNKPIVCSVGVTLCFYTKQYFVFVAAGIFVYMLIYSRKEAFRFALWTFCINLAVGGVICFIMPLFFIKTILFTYLGTVTGGGTDLTTLISQMKYLIVLFAALFSILIVTFSIAIGRIMRQNGKLRSIIRIKENDVFSLSVVMSVVMLVPLVIIGRNDGAFITYFLQLWMPSIIVVSLICFERIIPEKHEIELICLYTMIAAFTIYFGFGKLPVHILSGEEQSNWDRAYNYTKSYSRSGDVYYSRSLAYDGFARGNGQWLCGHEGEVSEYTVSILAYSGLPVDYFQYTDELVDQNLRYRREILKRAERHEYSLITIEPVDTYDVFDEQNCQEFGYKRIDTIVLQLGNMPYEVEFYARQ